MSIKLVKLDHTYRRHLTEMMEEWLSVERDFSPYAIRKNDYMDFDRYLAELETKEDTDALVTDSTFFALDTQRDIFVGAINIRHRLNAYLLREGGHIGDGIRPSERRKGYATRMIALGLEECRKLAIPKVLMVCDRDNIASSKSIEKNGGILENEVTMPDGNVIRRYWINLLPEPVRSAVGDLPCVPVTDDHRSGDMVYRVGEGYMLKISSDPERTAREAAANDFLKGKLNVSESVAYAEENGRGYYLKTRVSGTPLTDECFLKNPEKLTEMLAKAHMCFRTLVSDGCTLQNRESVGRDMVHGDFCLPNILVRDDGSIAFIDVEAAGLGDRWMDIAWSLWSLQYNLGTDAWNAVFLEKIGERYDDAKYRAYTEGCD